MLTRLRLRSTEHKSLLSALEDDSVVERFRLILQPAIDSKLEPVTTALQQTVQDLQQAVGALQATVVRKDKEILGLRREVQHLQEQAEALEQQACICTGVWRPTTDNKLLDLCNQRMKIHPPITLDDIDVSHRVGKLTTREPQSGQPTKV